MKWGGGASGAWDVALAVALRTALLSCSETGPSLNFDQTAGRHDDRKQRVGNVTFLR